MVIQHSVVNVLYSLNLKANIDWNNQTLRSKNKMGLISNGTTIFDAGSLGFWF